MAAGLGFKTFTTGEVLTAADTNGYLMQGVLVFASSAARSAAITSPQEGQYSYLKDTNSTEYYDGAAWIAAPIGDITGVTAGTGISGGGTSGTVTITNSMATEITAKGDLIAGTGSATFDNLAVGTNGQTLVADSTASTGLKWATPASGSSFEGCGLTKLSGAQSIPNATYTAVTWVESFDVGGYHDDATNPSRITIPTGKGGKYRFSWREGITIGVATVRLYVNGTGGTSAAVLTTISGEANGSTKILNLAAADYVEVYLYQASGSAKTAYDETNGATGQIWFDCDYLGA
jgi:hypothetical protein